MKVRPSPAGASPSAKRSAHVRNDPTAGSMSSCSLFNSSISRIAQPSYSVRDRDPVTPVMAALSGDNPYLSGDDSPTRPGRMTRVEEWTNHIFPVTSVHHRLLVK